VFFDGGHRRGIYKHRAHPRKSDALRAPFSPQLPHGNPPANANGVPSSSPG
jgi:hypothetical protein